MHILSDKSKEKERTIQEQIRYWKKISLMLTYAEKMKEESRIQFHYWLVKETERLGYEETYSKDKLLIYRRK